MSLNKRLITKRDNVSNNFADHTLTKQDLENRSPILTPLYNKIVIPYSLEKLQTTNMKIDMLVRQDE